MHIFEPESSLMKALSRIADLVILNLAVLLLCIPVITTGAALTGMHYVLLKMVRNEEGYILRSFFRSFRENFRQATAIWALFLFFSAVLYFDLSITGLEENAGSLLLSGMRLFLISGGTYIFLMYLYVFPLLARYHNTAAGTLKNAARLVLAAFPRTLAMALATAALPLAVLAFPPVLPVFLLAGLTGPGFVCACLYSPLFRRIEKEIEE